MSSSVLAVSEMQLIENFVQGDRGSFTILYKRYWYKLFLIANRRLHDKEASEELIQEIFVKLWENRETLQIACIENYLVGAVRYSVIDHVRKEMVRNKYINHYKTFVGQEDSETEQIVAVNDLTNTIEAGLRFLPEKSQEIFKLSRMESWPVSKIADHLQLSEKGVEYHITKTIRTLKLYLRDFVAIATLISLM